MKFERFAILVCIRYRIHPQSSFAYAVFDRSPLLNLQVKFRATEGSLCNLYNNINWYLI